MKIIEIGEPRLVSNAVFQHYRFEPISLNVSFMSVLKETPNSSKIRPMDLEKKVIAQLRLSLLCYFTNLFTKKRCLILMGDQKIDGLIKKEDQGCFPVNFPKFLRTSIL